MQPGDGQRLFTERSLPRPRAEPSAARPSPGETQTGDSGRPPATDSAPRSLCPPAKWGCGATARSACRRYLGADSVFQVGQDEWVRRRPDHGLLQKSLCKQRRGAGRSPVSAYTLWGHADTPALCPHPPGKVAETNCANHDSASLFPAINRIPQLSNPRWQKPVNNSGSTSSLLLPQLSPGTLALKQHLLLSKDVPLPPMSCPGGSRILH